MVEHSALASRKNILQRSNPARTHSKHSSIQGTRLSRRQFGQKPRHCKLAREKAEKLRKNAKVENVKIQQFSP